jgi:hypothetical protein
MRRVKNGKTEEETAGRDRGDEAKSDREREKDTQQRKAERKMYKERIRKR